MSSNVLDELVMGDWKRRHVDGCHGVVVLCYVIVRMAGDEGEVTHASRWDVGSYKWISMATYRHVGART